jgi:3-oxoacyl-[acyl-carrier protein] reductase
MRLKGKVAIVTGSAQGMGYAIARVLAEQGVKVVICDIAKDGVEKAVFCIKGEYEDVLGEAVDVTKKEQVTRVVGNVLKRWKRIDILVNNAGGALHTPHILEEIEEKDWNLVVDVNLKGTFLFCQAVIPIMVKRGGGSIVNISALAAHWRASLAGVQYTAAKAGVEGITRQLAYDWGPFGVRVNAVAPTVTITGDRVKGLWEAKKPEEQERVLSQIPLRRLSTPEEIAAAVVFLASDESSYITGITLDVSGGRYLR